jgi:iron complex outermembrane receptor protein
MMWRTLSWPVVAVAALMAGPGHAANAMKTFRVPPGALDVALGQLSKQAEVDLLFDPSMTARKRTHGVSGRLSPEDALDQLLEESGLTYRRAATGGYVILQASPGPALQAIASPPAETLTTVPELLVVGRKNLNSDIRRSRDDIQPYQISTGAEIVRSQARTIEDYLRSRSPNNAEQITENQTPTLKFGSSRSAINLGGFGQDQTLVLVDGRRLPGVMVAGLYSPEFLQADLNGIPPAAIDRIETLTSTSGGIYGPGAVGGVVNVVLKRNYDGLALSGATGGSDRGDGRRWRLDGSIGAASASGDTRVFLAVSHARDDGLRVGQRDFMIRARRLRDRNGLTSEPPISPSINIKGLAELRIANGPPLLNGITHAPVSTGLTAGGLTSLTSNAGTYDLELSPDGSGALENALSSTTVNSAIFSLRQTMSSHLELFFDALYFGNKGTAFGPWLMDPRVYVPAGANGNPFDADVVVSFPTPGKTGSYSTDIRTARLTAGAIVQLPRGWSGALDATLARTRMGFRLSDAGEAYAFVAKTNVDLFDGVSALDAALTTVDQRLLKGVLTNTMSDVNLRLAGPLLYTAAGPTTLSILAETRTQRIPDIAPRDPADVGLADVPFTDQSERVDSLYAELRAPLVPLFSRTPLRGLEIQLAARTDRFVISSPTTAGASDFLNGETVLKVQQRTSTLTTGFKVLPLDGLLLRTSYATGYLPPRPSQLLPRSFWLFPFLSGLPDDPKRPGDRVAANNNVHLKTGGAPDLASERATTFSTGIVLTPTWTPGLRVSVDYTRIHKSREIVDPTNGKSGDYFALEGRYPDIVRRAPLTPEDAAKGYTVGPVVFIDTSLKNIGASTTEMVDFNLEDLVDTRVGQLRFYGRATWQPNFTRRTTPLAPAFQTVGRVDGPLPVRGNAGVDWSSGPWEAGVNVQFYSHYRITYGASDFISAQLSEGPYGTLRYQGSETIPSQTYVDASLGYVFSRGGVSTLFRLGVRNLFDARPPLVAIPLLHRADPNSAGDEGIGYSPYGDPRGRRLEISLSRHF